MKSIKNQQLSTDWNRYIGTSIFSAGVFRGYQKFLPYFKKEWPEGAKILELGSGTGRLSFWLSRILPVSEVVLVDLNERLLKKSRKIFSSVNIPARFIKEDIRELDLKEKFALVHSAGVIEHFSHEDQIKIMNVYKYHCQPGGWAICYAPIPTKSYLFWRGLQEIMSSWKFPDEKPILKKELIQLFQNSGFDFITFNKVWNLFLTEGGILAKLPPK